MRRIKKLLIWLDEHILEVSAGFLLVFIPLYPKWPLADVLPGYIVRLRLEDILIGGVLFIWLVQVLRKKVSPKDNPLTLPILIYLGIGLLSSFSALFISKTIPLERIHVAKLFLHWTRRVEYMSLAFIFFSATKTSRQIKRLVTILGLVVIVTALYGLGQKYFQWPVYSTMNREFAKGWRLVLTEHARVPSTFAGHYDFAAFSVIVLAVFAGILSQAKKAKISKKYIIVFLAAFLSLLLTASRTSFIAYLVAITVVIIGLSFHHNITWAAKRWLGLMTLSIIGMLLFGDLSQRFAHFFKIDQLKDYIAYKIIKKDRLKETAPVKLSEDLALVYTETDQPPIPVESLELPPDVFENIPVAFPEATLSAGAGPEVASLAGKPRTYSPAAFTFGLSSAIRFDALWPRAIKGFLKNPILGSGYSSLTKSQFTEFTEAESTDNDFLRALGETGILGFISFFGILGFALFSIWKKRNTIRDPFIFALAVGIGGAIVGMIVNGLYIDVFEASKVAYTFWAMMGILFASLKIASKKA
jgi:hypothetical protein